MERDGVNLSQLAYLMVVRRGDHDRYRFLNDAFRDRPVSVLWDRRLNDRRRRSNGKGSAAAERRLTDRRQEPPLTWDNLGFLVARMKLDEEKG